MNPIEAIVSAIILIFGLSAIGWGLWATFWEIHDHIMQKRIRRGATKMSIDELKMRRLAKAVRQRVQTRRLANKGFTLIELIIVLAIFGTLSWLALTTVDRIQKARASFMAECRYPKTECENQWKNKTR